MFENFSQKLHEIISKTSSNKVLTEDNMQEALREIRRALLDADVNLKVVKSFVSSIKEKCTGEKILQSVDASSMLIKLVQDELVKVLGNKFSPICLPNSPSIVMMLGLQGSGKTTSAAKLALRLKKQGKKVLLVACDIYRAAAVEQLKILSDQVAVEFFSGKSDEKDVLQIVKKSLQYAKENSVDVVILDTAGRLQMDSEMMAELMLIDKSFEISEKLLVIDSMVGQEAVNIASAFDVGVGVSGFVLTKLDGDTRGGAALSVVYCTDKPIKFIGTGEKTEALEEFYPERMASRILGMGDVVSLVQKAQDVFDKKEALELEKKLKKSEFSYNDFLNIKKQMNKLGSLSSILSMLPIPGINGEMKDAISEQGEKQFKKIEAMISSMTKAERSDPDLINASRKKRISKGSGISLNEINIMISQFEQMRKMMKNVSKFSNSMKNKKTKFHPSMMNRLFK